MHTILNSNCFPLCLEVKKRRFFRPRTFRSQKLDITHVHTYVRLSLATSSRKFRSCNINPPSGSLAEVGHTVIVTRSFRLLWLSVPSRVIWCRCWCYTLTIVRRYETLGRTVLDPCSDQCCKAIPSLLFTPETDITLHSGQFELG